MKYNEFACIGTIEGQEYSYKYKDGKHYLKQKTFENADELMKVLGDFDNDSAKDNDQVIGKFELIVETKIILNSDNLESFLDALPNALELDEKELAICKEFGPLAYSYISE